MGVPTESGTRKEHMENELMVMQLYSMNNMVASLWLTLHYVYRLRKILHVQQADFDLWLPIEQFDWSDFQVTDVRLCTQYWAIWLVWIVQ